MVDKADAYVLSSTTSVDATCTACGAFFAAIAQERIDRLPVTDDRTFAIRQYENERLEGVGPRGGLRIHDGFSAVGRSPVVTETVAAVGTFPSMSSP